MLTEFQSVANVVDSETVLVKGSDLRDNFLQLKDMGLIPAWIVRHLGLLPHCLALIYKRTSYNIGVSFTYA